MAKNKVVSKTRRANGEGSIYQRSFDGKWVGCITIGYDEKGNQKKKSVYGNSQTEVAKKLSEISGRIKSNSYELVETKHLDSLWQTGFWCLKRVRSVQGLLRELFVILGCTLSP